MTFLIEEFIEDLRESFSIYENNIFYTFDFW